MGFFSFFKSKAVTPVEPESGKPGTDLHEPASETAGELMIRAINRRRQELRADEQKEGAENAKLLASATEKVQAAERLVAESGIDRALLRLLEEFWHWPTWSKRDDFGNHCNLRLENLDAVSIKTETEEGIRIAFDYRQVPLTFQFVESKSYSPDYTKYGTISLLERAAPVISISVYHDLEKHREYYQWSKLSTDQLAPGEWMLRIVEMEAEIESSKKARFEELRRERILKQAANLPDAQ